jgi:dienelactone hydrolase
LSTSFSIARRRSSEALRDPRLILPALFIGAVLLAPHLAPVRTAALTVALVPEMLDMSVRPLSAATADPTRESVSYGTPSDRMDVYLPAGAASGSGLPAVVLELGVHPQPIEAPEIVHLASTIARAGVVVGVPDSTALRNLQVTPEEPAHLADAVLVLAQRPEVDPERIGLAGFSAGASIALIAATDERLAGHLDYVSSFGGYADARRLLVDVATRTSTGAAGTIAWQPDPGIRHDVLELALGGLADQPERDRLRAVLAPIVAADAPPSGPPPGAEAFSGDAAALLALFSAPSRAAGEAAVASLSPSLLARLDAISPITVADRIGVPVFLLHGVADTAIPVAHAELLRDAIGDQVARLTEFGRFGHGQPGANGLSLDDAGDVVALALYLRDIVAAATE